MLNQDILKSSFSAQYQHVLVKSGAWILLIAILSSLADQKLTETLDTLLRSPEGVDAQVWIYGSLSILNGLAMPTLIGVFVLSSFSGLPLRQFLRKYLSYSFKENLRVYGQALLGSYLLILPGIIRFLRCSFVPFIVCFETKYDLGEIDALELSRKISKGLLLPIAGLFVLSFLTPQMILAVGDEYRLITLHPVSGIGLVVVQMLLEILFMLLLFKLYRRKVQL